MRTVVLPTPCVIQGELSYLGNQGFLGHTPHVQNQSLKIPTICLLIWAVCGGVAALANWPQWRGPLATGEATNAQPPTVWSETNNIRWKAAIPGNGSSTPAVWEDRIFVTTAVVSPAGSGAPDGEYSFQIFCLDRRDGKVLWSKTPVKAVPHEKHHQDHGYASGSPVTDGRYVLAYYGSRGLHCFDLDGNVKWSRQFGKMQTRNSFGEGASPALFNQTIVVNWDDESTDDFIAAIDLKTGKELWRAAREENTGWATPLILTHGGRQQVVVNAAHRVRSYDLGTGRQIWECGGQTVNPIPTPVADQDTVYVTSGYRGSAALAIALGREGDLTGTDAIRWSHGKNTPYVPSPLLAAGLLYLVSGNNPVISCLDARTGEPRYEAARLEGLTGIYASPTYAAGKVYVLGRNGVCCVIKAGNTLKVLATNRLEDKTDASPVLVGRDLFIRGRAKLYCITEP